MKKLTPRHKVSNPDPQSAISDVESQQSRPPPSSPPRQHLHSPPQRSGPFSNVKETLANGITYAAVLTILKDIIAGTILGSIFLLVLVFLDYSNIIQLSSAKAMRGAAFRMMNDPETLKSLEDNLDVKFIPMDTYDNLQREIDKNRKMLADSVKTLEERSGSGKESEVQLELLQKEFMEWKAKGDLVLGLNQFCPECKWGGGGTCEARVKYLMDTYGDGEVKSKAALLQQGRCKKN